jgi:hypothetical protein
MAEAKKHGWAVIGMWNVGAYTHGRMSRTPHIDSQESE